MFLPMFPFYTSWKHQKTFGFRGYKTGTLTRNGLKGHHKSFSGILKCHGETLYPVNNLFR